MSIENTLFWTPMANDRGLPVTLGFPSVFAGLFDSFLPVSVKVKWGTGFRQG